MEQGFIKLYRQVKQKGWYKNSKYVHLWVHILLKANHKQAEFMWNKEIIIIKEGQFITGRKQLAEETGLTQSTVENILKTFENEHQIEQQKTTKFRLITVVNWKEYQQDKQQNRQQSNNRVTTKQQQSDTNKNEKNEKNEKNNNSVCFEKFWSLYPKKISKKKTMEIWNKIKPDKNLLEVILKAIEVAKKTDQWKRGYIPHPTTYLNQERWNDEISKKEIKDLADNY